MGNDSSLSSLLFTLSSLFLGGRAYSALPCAGAPPPQRPLQQHASSTWCRYSQQVPNRKCLARPRPVSHIKSFHGHATRLPCFFSKAGKQFRPPLSLIPCRTVPTPNLGCTPAPHRRDRNRKLRYNRPQCDNIHNVARCTDYLADQLNINDYPPPFRYNQRTRR